MLILRSAVVPVLALFAGFGCNSHATVNSDVKSGVKSGARLDANARPVILVRSGWQTVNIGDVAHTIGMLNLLQERYPNTKLILWPDDIRGEVEPLLRSYFPTVEIVHGKFDADKKVTAPDVLAAFDRADLFLCSSGPDVGIASAVFAEWHRHHAGDVKNHPYGFFGLTVDRESMFARIKQRDVFSTQDRKIVDNAAFFFARDTASLDYLRRQKVTTPVLDFTPDAVFAVNQYDTARANAWLKTNGLEKGGYICVIGRTRFAPYYKIKGLPRTENDAVCDEYNARHLENDLGKIRAAITRFIKETRKKVVLCPEMTFEVELAKTEIYDKLPEEIRRNVVWKSEYWMPDEAAAVYRDAIALLSMECHSPIIAAAAGVPAIYLRTETETNKGQMWNDLGLGDRMFSLDDANVTGDRLADELIAILEDPRAAREKTARAMEKVRKFHQIALTRVDPVLQRIPAREQRVP